MPTSAILLGYQERILSLQAAASQLRLGQMIALGLLVAAFVSVGLLAFWAMAHRTVPLYSSLIPLTIAIFAGKARRERSKELLQCLRLERFYQRGIDRLEGRWVGTGDTGDDFADVAGHPYAEDLHVFGEGSLFELLCTCRTDVGKRRLAQYFLNSPTIEEARRRQQAVQELQANVALREQLHLLGEYSFQQSSWNTMMEWLSSPVVRATRWFRILALLLSVAVVVLFVAERMAFLNFQQMALPMGALLLVGGGMGLVYRKQVLAAQPAIRALSLELGVLREGLGHLQTQNFDSPLLRELTDKAAESDPASTLRRLQRLANALRERDKEWFYHASRALLIGTQVFLAIEAWRSSYGAVMRQWLDAWGEFEALMALANYAAEHPENTFPNLVENRVALECEAAGHPLLPQDVCVRNDIACNEATRFYVVSGSNMAGKSTLLRTVGLNTVLAYAGAPVCASRMTLSRLWICASISIQDSLLSGQSKFMAEVQRLKQALTLEPSQRPVLFLIDEILSGTNSQDRRTAAEAILRMLLAQGAIGAISTHDLTLTELAELPELAGTNVHMGSRDAGDPLCFDFLLKPGVTQQSNALAIARLAGVQI